MSSSAEPRTWVRRILSGGRLTEVCPEWCTDGHAGDDRSTSIDDLQHGASMPALAVSVDMASGSTDTVGVPALVPRIEVEPYSDDPARAVPHVVLEVFESEYTAPLDPEELAAVIETIRRHCDRLEFHVLPQLRTAKAEHAIARCVYCKEPSTTSRTGQLDNRYGLCADCGRVQDSMETAAEVTA